MNELPRQKLREIVARHGPSIIADARRCEALLRDHLGAHRREANVLASALEERVPQDILAAPAGTPRAIVEQLSATSRAALAEPDFQRALITAGTEPVLDSGPEKTRRFVEEEIARWTPIINEAGLKQ